MGIVAVRAQSICLRVDLVLFTVMLMAAIVAVRISQPALPAEAKSESDGKRAEHRADAIGGHKLHGSNSRLSPIQWFACSNRSNRLIGCIQPGSSAFKFLPW
jgi:hypothetical protein